MSTLTAYPDPGTGGASVDGGIYRANSDASWDLCRNNTTGTLRGNSAAECYIIGEYTGFGYQLEHLILSFDTSSLGAEEITEAVFSLFPNTAVVSQLEATYPANPQIFEGSPASDTTLVGDDYNNFGSTALCDSPPTLATMAASSAYHPFAFNASGIAAIDTAGVTGICVRPLNAVNGTAPTARSYIAVYMADQTGTANDPKLVITYTSGGTTYECSVAFDASAAMTNSASLNGQSSCSLGASVGNAYSAALVANAALALDSDAAMTAAAQLEALGSFTLVVQAALSPSAGLSANSALSLDASAAVSPSAQAEFGASLTLSAEASQTILANLVTTGLLTLDTSAAAQLSGGLVYDTTLALDASAGMTPSANLVGTGTVTLSASVAAEIAAALVAQATLLFDAESGFTAEANLLLDAALELTAGAEITFTGEVQTPLVATPRFVLRPSADSTAKPGQVTWTIQPRRDPSAKG